MTMHLTGNDISDVRCQRGSRTQGGKNGSRKGSEVWNENVLVIDVGGSDMNPNNVDLDKAME